MTAAIRIFAPDAQFPAQAIVDAFLADAESRRRSFRSSGREETHS